MSQLIFFPADTPREFDWPVTAQVPADGGPQKQTFTARYRELSQTQMDAIKDDPQADVRLCEAALIGWQGVVDADGNEVKYNDTRRDQLIARPYIRLAIATAYYDAIIGNGIGGRDRGN